MHPKPVELPPAPDRARRESRRRAVLDIVDAHLCEPEISTRAIAGAAGVSPRYVQMIFAGMGTTPSAYICRRRLDVAAERLRHLGKAASITGVAFDLGFNDLSSFCRAFRRRFGQAPRDYRAAPMESAAA
jgi:AraC family transcriptional activator of tynA and feaB